MAALVWVVLLHNFIGVVSQDPCLTNQRFLVGSDRDPSSATQGVPTCDLMAHQWYRVIGPGEIDLDLARQAPEENHCATQWPMWMDGTLPAEGIESEVHICMIGYFDPCDTRMSIRVKNCSQYRVYKLREPDLCPSAYCFDVPTSTDAPPAVTCPNETIAIDGNPTVQPSVVDSDDPELIPDIPLVLEELQFQCSFNGSSSELFYDVKWYINNLQLEFEQKAVPGHNLTTATLREQYWRDRFKMGMKVACSVAVRVLSTCNPGPERRSSDFFAGIRVSPESLSMLETSPPQKLTYTSTVPIPCAHRPGESQTCSVILDASGRNSSLGCPIKPSSENSIHTSSCSLTFTSAAWQTPQTLEISVTYNTDYEDHTSLIFLKAKPRWTRFPDIWKDVVVSPARVNVRDEDHFQRNSCGAFNDPVYSTFDGSWFPSSLHGEFVLFRHKIFPLAVHIVQSACDMWITSCICGVAVQSGQDIFMWAGCGDVYKIYKNFRIRSYGCFKSGMKLEEIVDGGEYQVILPTGMKVKMKLRAREPKFINVDIYATPDTEGLVGGLCGIKDASWWDTQDLSSFRVHQNDSLFHRAVRSDWSYHSLCTCRSDSNASSEESKRLMACSNARTTDSCSVPGKDVTQIYAETCRQKRDVAVDDLDEEWPDFKLNESYIPPTPEWKNGWTSALATQHCWDYFHDSQIYKHCNGLANLNPSLSINMCVYMIQETGSINWSEVTLDAYKAQCQDEVSRNSSLWSTVPGQPSVFDLVMSLMCPDNCNDRGSCHRGTCQCDSGYTGADCGLDISQPPSDLVLPHLGMCDLKNGNPCQQSLVFGSQFIGFGKFGYKAELIQVTRDKTLRTGKVTRRSAVAHSRNEAKLVFDRVDSSAEMKDLNEPFVVGYKFTMTNDDVIYGEENIFLPYDSTCFSCSVTGAQASCSIKTGYCSINQRCVAGGQTNPDNICQVCVPVKSTFNWTFKDCQVSTRPDIPNGHHTDKHIEDTPPDMNTGVTSPDKHVDGTPPYMNTGVTSPDKHVDETPPDMNTGVTSPVKHIDGTPRDMNTGVTSPDKHVDGCPPDMNTGVTSPDKHVDGTPPDLNTGVTSPDKHVDGTPPDMNTGVTSPVKHIDGTPRDMNTGVTSPVKHIDGTPRDMNTGVTSPDKHVDGTPPDMNTGVTSPDKHVDGTPPDMNTGVTSPVKHIDGTPRDMNTGVTSPDKHVDGTPPDMNTGVTSPDKHVDGTPPDLNTGVTSPDKHVDGTPPDMNTGVTSPDKHVDGTPPDMNTGVTSPVKHIDGTPTHKHVDGTPPDKHVDGHRPITETPIDNHNKKAVLAATLTVGIVAFILSVIATSIAVYKKSPIFAKKVRIKDAVVEPSVPPPPPYKRRPLSVMSANSITETFTGLSSGPMPPTSTALAEKQEIVEKGTGPTTANESNS